jgi:hypothetical protein
MLYSGLQSDFMTEKQGINWRKPDGMRKPDSVRML